MREKTLIEDQQMLTLEFVEWAEYPANKRREKQEQ